MLFPGTQVTTEPIRDSPVLTEHWGKSFSSAYHQGSLKRAELWFGTNGVDGGRTGFFNAGGLVELLHNVWVW